MYVACREIILYIPEIFHRILLIKVPGKYSLYSAWTDGFFHLLYTGIRSMGDFNVFMEFMEQLIFLVCG